MSTTLYRSRLHWNHYRIPSARAAHWDYGKNGIYYVTICTKHRQSFFGTLRNGQVELSDLGRLARAFWLSIPEHTLPGVRLKAFQVMPNHIHGVLELDRAVGEEPLCVGAEVETVYYQSQLEREQHPPHPHSDFPPARSAYFARIRPRKGSLPQLIRSFKALVTKHARRMGIVEPTQPLWQSRFYDRIVRNERELERIERHILNNPQCWPKDDYYVPVAPQEEHATRPRKRWYLHKIHRSDVQPLAGPKHRVPHRQTSRWIYRRRQRWLKQQETIDTTGSIVNRPRHRSPIFVQGRRWRLRQAFEHHFKT